MQQLPERIELTALGAALRRHRVDDLDVLQEAIEMSRDHLRPWMVWADQSRDATAQFLSDTVHNWEEGRDFGYLIVDADDTTVLGGTGLHGRLGPHGLEIGYWRRVDVGGRGLVTASAGALTRSALALEDIERVEIHCDTANTASAAVPRRLGYTLERIADRPIAAPGEQGREMIWTCGEGQLNASGGVASSG